EARGHRTAEMPGLEPTVLSFCQLLRDHREAAGLSQEELADRAGISAQAGGALERGQRRRPHPHTVRALARALALSDGAEHALWSRWEEEPSERPTRSRTGLGWQHRCPGRLRGDGSATLDGDERDVELGQLLLSDVIDLHFGDDSLV